MRLDNLFDELEPGRLFTYGQLNDAMTGGPALLPILAAPGAGAEAFIKIWRLRARAAGRALYRTT
jgi:hypothetical protein